MCIYTVTPNTLNFFGISEWQAASVLFMKDHFQTKPFKITIYQFHFKLFIDIIITFWDPSPEGEERHYLHIDASAMSILLYSNNASKLRKQASYGVYKFRKTKEPFFRPVKFGKKWHFWPRPYFGNFIIVNKIICRSRICRRKWEANANTKKNYLTWNHCCTCFRLHVIWENGL